jgi:hypothetical protein
MTGVIPHLLILLICGYHIGLVIIHQTFFLDNSQSNYIRKHFWENVHIAILATEIVGSPQQRTMQKKRKEKKPKGEVHPGQNRRPARLCKKHALTYDNSYAYREVHVPSNTPQSFLACIARIQWQSCSRNDFLFFPL